MSHLGDVDRHLANGNDAQAELQVTEQPDSMHAHDTVCNQDEHAKKQRIMVHVPGILDTETFTYALNDLTLSTNIANGRINIAPFEEQPLALDPHAHMHVSSTVKPVVLITAFSYERYAGLVPLLPTVAAEANHISVRACY